MIRLAPGVYDDEQGGLQLDMAEVLAAAGYADTPANRATLIQAARDAWPTVEISDAPWSVEESPEARR